PAPRTDAPRLTVRIEELRLEVIALGPVATLLVATLLEGHGDLVDARALDLEHVEAHAVVRDVVADLRLTPEQPEDEAGERVVVLVRQMGVKALVEVVDRERPVDAD